MLIKCDLNKLSPDKTLHPAPTAKPKLSLSLNSAQNKILRWKIIPQISRWETEWEGVSGVQSEASLAWYEALNWVNKITSWSLSFSPGYSNRGRRLDESSPHISVSENRKNFIGRHSTWNSSVFSPITYQMIRLKCKSLRLFKGVYLKLIFISWAHLSVELPFDSTKYFHNSFACSPLEVGYV